MWLKPTRPPPWGHLTGCSFPPYYSPPFIYLFSYQLHVAQATGVGDAPRRWSSVRLDINGAWRDRSRKNPLQSHRRREIALDGGRGRRNRQLQQPTAAASAELDLLIRSHASSFVFILLSATDARKLFHVLDEPFLSLFFLFVRCDLMGRRFHLGIFFLCTKSTRFGMYVETTIWFVLVGQN